MSKILLLCLTLGAITLRSLLSLQPYSGYATPPKYGDFEAQRHWQEITINLPIVDWYTNTSHNDLMYWGLDYPPLTAYHSWLLGMAAKQLNESYVELHTSRGITTDAHKAFMRTTVLAADLLLYLPALLIAVWSILPNRRNVPDALCYSIALFYPGQILIDNGHFQYNNVSLGFACLAIAAIFSDAQRLAAVLFVFALNYKQMELYHALPFFVYLLANCFSMRANVTNGFWSNVVTGMRKVLSLAVIVVVLFALIWLPWLGSWQRVIQVVHRIFPVARGVFEDKVSNVWCVINVFYKLKDNFTNEQMAIVCIGCTLAASLPSCLHLLFNARKHYFLLSLINCSLAFFLFSFQVHEKTILLVTLPVLLHFPHDPLPSLWFLQIATFSMLPLLVVDRLILASVVVSVIYLLLIRLITMLSVTNSRAVLSPKWDFLSLSTISDNRFWNILFYLSTFVGCSVLLLCLQFVTPPHSLPFLFPLLTSIYCCVHFLIFFIYFNYRQLFVADAEEIEVGERTSTHIYKAPHIRKQKATAQLKKHV